MCLHATCGDNGPNAKLDDRAPACLKGECASCGFKRLWSGPGGVRDSLALPTVRSAEDDGNEEGHGLHTALDLGLRDDIDPSWLSIVSWSRYVYKKSSATKLNGTEDEDEAFAQTKENRQLEVERVQGTIVEFLDDFEVVISKHLCHRATLASQRTSSLQFDRNSRPGTLREDVDYAENASIKVGSKMLKKH